MPKIEITEFDNTSPGVLDENFDVVYIPGFVNTSAVDDENILQPRVPTLFTSLKTFTTKCGNVPATFKSTQYFTDLNADQKSFETDAVPFTGVMFKEGDADPSYIMAKELLAAGLNVVYERINNSVDVSHSTEPVYKPTEDGKSELQLKAGNSYQLNIPALRPIFSSCPPVLFAHVAEDVEITANNCQSFYKCLATEDENGLPIPEFERKYEALETLEDAETFVVIRDSKKYVTPTSGLFILQGKYYPVIPDSTVANPTYLICDRKGVIITKDAPVVNYDFITAYPEDWDSRYFLDYYEDTTIKTTATCTLDGDGKVDIDIADVDGVNISESLLSEATYQLIEESVTINKLYAALYDIFDTSNVEGIVDRGNVNIKYLTAGGYPVFEYAQNDLASKMLAVAAHRGDCVALIDHTDNPYRETNVDKEASLYQAVIHSEPLRTNGDFGAMFTPWCTYNRLTSDNSDSSPVRLGGSFAYLTALADSIKTNAPWLAIAGVTRGKVPNLSENGITTIITNGAADFMQPRSSEDHVGVAVNAITDIKPYGNVIWGNRTLKKNDDNLTATSFLNIRNLVCDVKKICYRTARRLTFEQNNDILWVNFKSMIAPTLDRMVSGYGISGYKFVRDMEHERASQKATLCAKIFLYPVEPVEDFYITIMLEDDEVTVQ